MFYLIVAAALCSNFTLVDNSGYGTKDKRTRQVIARALIVCDKRYDSCLARVTRNTETDYSVLCGGRSDEIPTRVPISGLRGL